MALQEGGDRGGGLFGEFKAFRSPVVGDGLVRPVAVDECYVVLDSGAGGGWRSRVTGLRGSVKVKTQIEYLTATLQPAHEAAFGGMVGLPAAPGLLVWWFHEATT